MAVFDEQAYLHSQEYQQKTKQHLKNEFKELKKDYLDQGRQSQFKWNLKTYGEARGFEWYGPPTPTTGLPNFNIQDAGDVSSDDGFEDWDPDAAKDSASKTNASTSTAKDDRQHLFVSPSPEIPAANVSAAEATPAEADSDAPMEIDDAPMQIDDTPMLDASEIAFGEAGPSTTAAGNFSSSAPAGQITSLANHPDWGMNIQWLKETKVDHKRNPQNAQNLSRVRELISQVKYGKLKPGQSIEQCWDQIRQQLHQFRHYQVDEKMVKASRLLEPQSGFPVLFLPESALQPPFDIAADAKELAVRWRRRQFSPDILHGIEFKGKKHGKLAKDVLRIRYDVTGAGDLVNGQWFPLWLAALRDGAHGSAQAGIYGKAGHGAFSVVMAGQYNDVDNGDTVEYCGVVSAAGASADATSTALLKENVGDPDRPVRLMRAANPKGSKYCPVRGVRYDGLYLVESYVVVNEATREYKFLLRRLEGQDPIRWEGAAKRPTEEELKELSKHDALLKGSAV